MLKNFRSLCSRTIFSLPAKLAEKSAPRCSRKLRSAVTSNSRPTTTTDIQAGKAAGMLTIGVLTGFDEYETLKKENPDAIIETVQHLQEVIEV